MQPRSSFVARQQHEMELAELRLHGEKEDPCRTAVNGRFGSFMHFSWELTSGSRDHSPGSCSGRGLGQFNAMASISGLLLVQACHSRDMDWRSGQHNQLGLELFGVAQAANSVGFS